MQSAPNNDRTVSRRGASQREIACPLGRRQCRELESRTPLPAEAIREAAGCESASHDKDQKSRALSAPRRRLHLPAVVMSWRGTIRPVRRQYRHLHPSSWAKKAHLIYSRMTSAAISCPCGVSYNSLVHAPAYSDRNSSIASAYFCQLSEDSPIKAASQPQAWVVDSSARNG